MAKLKRFILLVVLPGAIGFILVVVLPGAIGYLIGKFLLP